LQDQELRHGQTTKGGPQARRFRDGLTARHFKSQLLTKCYAVPRTWQALVKTVMNIRVPQKVGNFSTS